MSFEYIELSPQFLPCQSVHLVSFLKTVFNNNWELLILIVLQLRRPGRGSPINAASAWGPGGGLLSSSAGVGGGLTLGAILSVPRQCLCGGRMDHLGQLPSPCQSHLRL